MAPSRHGATQPVQIPRGTRHLVHASLAYAAPIKDLKQLSLAIASRSHRWYDMLGRHDEHAFFFFLERNGRPAVDRGAGIIFNNRRLHRRVQVCLRPNRCHVA